MTNEIIHIELNDWDCTLKSDKCRDLFDKLLNGKLEDIYFNYSLCNVDMAMCFFITTTKEDIIKYGYDELLNYIEDGTTSLVTPNFYMPYNPSKWHDKEKNGLYFSSYEYFRTLYLIVDKNGREYMVDYEHFPVKNDDFLPTFIKNKDDLDKTNHYITNDRFYKVSYGCGWCQDIEEKEINGETINVPVFEHFVNLPKGFIENYLGKKMTYEDKPVQYKTFELEKLKIWEE